jgi:hypothetical protein
MTESNPFDGADVAVRGGAHMEAPLPGVRERLRLLPLRRPKRHVEDGEVAVYDEKAIGLLERALWRADRAPIPSTPC